MSSHHEFDKDVILEPLEDSHLYPRALREKEKRHGGDPKVGVALSGGGIRSATLCLGFFQALAQSRVLRHVDILSTVSGGGYFGGFYGHLVQRANEQDWAEVRAGSKPEDRHKRSIADRVLRDKSWGPVKFLRENGRYLAPSGSGDLIAAGAVALRNWASVIVVMSLLALLVLSLISLARFTAEGALLTRIPQVSWPIAWLSPVFFFSLAAIPLLAVPPAWAYWLVWDNPQNDGNVRWLVRWGAPAAAVGYSVWTLRRIWSQPVSWSALEWTITVVGAVATLTTLLYGASRLWFGRDPSALRNYFSRFLARMLVLVGLLFALALIDTVGQAIFAARNGGLALGYGGAIGLIGVFRSRLLTLVSKAPARAGAGVPTKFLVPLIAFVLMLAFLGGVASVTHFVARAAAPLPIWFPAAAPANVTTRLLLLIAASAGLVYASSRLWSFVNRSSLHALYEARLRRAYLGASNKARSGQGEHRPPVTEPHADDGMAWLEYQPKEYGGPIHLVNVTINETVDGQSQVQQQDSKGTGMAIGPEGVSVGRRHHALWAQHVEKGLLDRAMEGLRSIPNRFSQTFRRPKAADAPKQDSASEVPYRVFPLKGGPIRPELLDVGQWIAISGGAVSTGIGARTNIGLSLLTGLFNVRLGYWWHSGVDPADREGRTRRTFTQRMLTEVRRALPMQMALIDEWLARFPGVARPEWNLSDGGHFENLGGYELLRRRLPMIIVCDNECDADYEYAGLANLVRKARTDLGATVTFLSDTQLGRKAVAEDDPYALTGKVRRFPQDAPAASDPAAPPRPLAPPIRMPDCVGSLDSLRRGRRSKEATPEWWKDESRLINDGSATGLSLVHAALAHVHYEADGDLPESDGWMLYVKPSLVGDEPIDIRHYHSANPSFPHQSTADQFFDEAQWESYRRLGEHLGQKLFDDATGLAAWVGSYSDVKVPAAGEDDQAKSA